ncbi:MAG: hypothetical protein AAF456_08290 [Planctomycetota bacterium]
MSIAEKSSKTQADQREADQREFVKRKPASWRYASAGIERRQFPNIDAELSPEADSLGEAVDRYKMKHGISRINYEELLQVIKAAGYSKD